jgi:hypothetical protein
MLWLGKIVINSDRGSRYFHIGDANAPRNSQRPQLNRAMWKLLAECAFHRLRIVSESEPGYPDLDKYTEIGGDKIGDISFDAYLKDWPG